MSIDRILLILLAVASSAACNPRPECLVYRESLFRVDAGTQFEFEVPEGAWSVAVGVVSREMTGIPALVDFEGPDGVIIDGGGDVRDPYRYSRAHQASTLIMNQLGHEHGQVSPGVYTGTAIPDVRDSEARGYLQVHTLMCRGAVEPVPKISFEGGIYESTGYSAEDGASTVLALMRTLNDILLNAGLETGTYRFYDIPGTEIPTGTDDLLPLWATVPDLEPRDLTEEGEPVRVVFVEEFGGDMATVIGVAPTVPGAVDSEGLAAGGVVSRLQTSTLSDDGNTLAHEIGHFLGLYHTTEFGFWSTDPLADTPECPDIGDSVQASIANERCPDVANLMFPTQISGDVRGLLSADQALAIASNPMLYPRANEDELAAWVPSLVETGSQAMESMPSPQLRPTCPLAPPVPATH
jgi:hypothetical protein